MYPRREVSARITRLDIEGLRVIDSVALDLRPVNVLIGENGSGKTTVLEALELMRKAATLSGDQFISELFTVHGGARLFRVGRRRLRLGTRVSGRGGWGSHDGFHYGFTLELGDGGGISVIEEHLLLDPLPNLTAPLRVLDRTRDRGLAFNQSTGKLEAVDVGGETLLLSALNAAPGGVLNASLPAVREFLGATRVYPAFEANPTWARRPGDPTSPARSSVVIRPATSVERGGANLPNAYQALRNRGDATWVRIRETLALGLGADVIDVSIDPDPSGGQVGLSLVFKSVGKVPAFALSDGQLSFLTLVAIAEFEADREGVIAFDELDLHQQPALLAYSVALAGRLANQRSVIMTTHSDRLLDALDDPAESAVLFERDHDGSTHALRPDREQLIKWLAAYAGLGSLRADGYAPAIFTEEVARAVVEGDP